MPYSFRDPVTGVLVAWGYVETNRPGDIRQSEPWDFNLEVNKWRWDDTLSPPAWVPYP